MKKCCLLSCVLFVALILVSCASVPKETGAATSDKVQLINKNFSQNPSTVFSPDSDKIYFGTYGPDIFHDYDGYEKLKYGIAHIQEDGFVYVAVRDDSTGLFGKVANLLSASKSFYTPVIGTPSAANPVDFITVVNEIFRDTADSRALPVISGVTSFDFTYKESNEFNTVSPEAKLEELRNVKDSEVEKHVTRNAKDLPRNYKGNCPYDFTFLCHWYSREFELDSPEYAGLVYHCVSTIETFTVTIYEYYNETMTAYISDFWIEGFEVYNVKTGTWEWYGADEYQDFMERNGFVMPVKFKEFIEMAPYCVARWFDFSTDMGFDASANAHKNLHKYSYSPIKHYASPLLEDLYDFKDGIIDMVVPGWDSIFF